MLFTIALLLLGLLPAAAQPPRPRELRSEGNQNLAPFVSTPQPIVDKMLEIATVKAGEIVYDLGCGDGRILIAAAQRYKAKGVGVEISERLVRSTTDHVRRLNLQDMITIRHGHLLDVDLRDADVVMIYLETGSNELLKPNLEKFLKPGSRVVSHDFEVRGWKPAKVEKINAFNRNHTIYLYELPASMKKSAR